MNMNKRTSKLQKGFIVVAIITVVLLGTAVIYSLGFLSNNLLRALRLETQNGEEVLEFNLNGFKSLGL